jgi:hypothetical protein
MRACHLVHSKAQLAGNGFPLSRVATQLWAKWRAPEGAMTKVPEGVDKWLDTINCTIYLRK